MLFSSVTGEGLNELMSRTYQLLQEARQSEPKQLATALAPRRRPPHEVFTDSDFGSHDQDVSLD
jgi:hypothetical protein